MLRKIKKMVFTNPRKVRAFGLCLILVGLTGFVYIEAVPIRKAANDGKAEMSMDQHKKSDNLQAGKLKFVPGEGVNAQKNAPNVPQLQDDLKHGIDDKKQNLGDKAEAKVPDMPAGGAPNAQVMAKPLAPEPNFIQGDSEKDAPGKQQQQLEKPNPAKEVHLARVPEHRNNQLVQPDVKNHMVDDDDHHPVKQAVFKDSNKPLKVKDLQPPDHLDAVRLEQDGHLNRDYRKEIFLGNHEEFEQGSEAEIEKKLKDIFHRIDVNADSFVSAGELEDWIIAKVQEHFAEAVEENENVFKALDTDNDGDITWREFHIQFLMAKGHEKEKAEQHMEDYETIPLESDDKEQLIRFKFRWAEADEDPQDNKLTMTEFRNFRHPEQSQNMLQRMVQDIIENLDKDHNGIVLMEEFAALPPGEVDDQWKDSDKIWQEERRKEFKEVIDLNKDGKVTREELMNYVDPKNPQHSKVEAQNLIELADSDKDGKLTLEEVLENTELFLGSKVVNTGRSFHDEF